MDRVAHPLSVSIKHWPLSTQPLSRWKAIIFFFDIYSIAEIQFHKMTTRSAALLSARLRWHSSFSESADSVALAEHRTARGDRRV